MSVHNTNKVLAVVISAATLVGMGACGGSSNSSAPNDSAKNSAKCGDYKQYGDLKGKTVTMYASWIDEEGSATDKSFDAFRQCTGANVKFEGSRDLAVQLPVRVKSGSAPDVAVVPQPGLLRSMVKTGKAKPAPDSVVKNVEKYYSKDWKEYGSVDGKLYGVAMDASSKSFIWYSPKKFKEKGYTVPQTWDEMMDLTKKIAKDNKGGNVKPWSVGIEGGSDTGWPATDWLEDAVIRFTDADTYNKWVSHEIPFNDPKILSSFKEIGKILKNNDYVNGGFGDSQSIASTAWQDAGNPLIEGTGYMMHMAPFYQTNFKSADANIKIDPDGDAWVFQMPGKEKGSAPMLGGGDFAFAFSDRPEVKAFLTYLSTPQWANERAKQLGGWVYPNKAMDESLLGSKIDKLSYEALTNPKTEFRFDASDLMPSEVGSGSFWKKMTEYFAQNKSEKETLDAIEASWPKDK
ncbi:alpha-glucoside transport system substrate-binding protein [Bifidobacterium bohemicum]|uniref:ABC transporter, solute-binding protein n=1 Tax=Bifidobacterium bohemicum DSM 22767 TaxID=1437606 RepID=A0A086ZKE7_9BIFI|nr:ABC transporter substrate-binding protein [Bifidobacterium bohemicum]KFI46997.1 ABC transporter, solute-binding protein [Bifidobacterium bohemicum DSM 22767]SCB87279.1 alpha-glucoside transport system substrate-binding protein [Bifidobacterium bohemicum]